MHTDKQLLRAAVNSTWNLCQSPPYFSADLSPTFAHHLSLLVAAKREKKAVIELRT